MPVMGVKTGVKSWAENKSSAPENSRSEIANNMSAEDMQKLGTDNVGDLLNKIADPNWVDPNKKVRSVGNDKLDKDAFMKLMLAQMKNQDPTNPMKNHELAAQLAQFSSVEQMTNMNSTLTEMKAAQKPTESFMALNFIGKAVSGDSAKLIRTKGDTNHDFNFNLPDNARNVEIKIQNENGEIVRKVDLKDLKKGANRWEWNGQDERGSAVPAGEYNFFVTGINSAGKKLNVKTDFEGVITGVNYTTEGPVLLVGTQSVKLKDVRKIIDPSLKSNDQKIMTGPQPDLKNVKNTLDNESNAKAGDPVKAGPSQLMSSVGMSNAMMAKLDKETKPDSGGKQGPAFVKPTSVPPAKESQAAAPSKAPTSPTVATTDATSATTKAEAKADAKVDSNKPAESSLGG